MPILRRALWMAAKRAAADPRVQAKAREVLQEEVVPRVRRTVDAARPEIQRARENIERAGREMKKNISESSATKRARDFLAGTKRSPD
jgi:predicted phage gp36 major capsid-like protein